jgi:uncharacterized protein (TIGR02231 family)
MDITQIKIKQMKMVKFILLIALAFSFNLSAQNNTGNNDIINNAKVEKRVNSLVTHVTVFNNQAQVTRTAKVTLNAGVNHIVFEKLSPYINLNSLEVKSDLGFTLMAISNRNNQQNPNEKPSEIVLLEDSLNNINAALADFKADKETIVHQKDLMLANKNVGSNQSGVKSDELEDLMDLYKKKLDDFKTNWFKLSDLEKKYFSYKNAIEAQLNEYNQGKLSVSNEVILTIKADNYIEQAPILISYLVSNVSWSPFYDIRVKDNKSKVQFFLKANINQSTGEDWNNVQLKLTTANPVEGGVKPELQTNWLAFNTNDQYLKTGNMNIRGARADGTAYYIEQTKKVYDKKEDIVVTQNMFNTEFETNIAYTIPSDNQNHQVDLISFSQEAIYGYAVVPKLSKDVFVTAQVLSNDLTNQISGEANVYYDGTFTGKTYIRPTTNDTLLLTLGTDKRIQVDRKKLKEFSSKSFFGGTKTESSTWEIVLKNTRKEPLTISIEDQIPVSTDKEIEVKLIDKGNAVFEENTGKLTWTINLAAEQSQVLKFSFEVKHPKNKPVTTY